MQSRNNRLPRAVKVPGGTTVPARLGNQRPGSLFVPAKAPDSPGPARPRGAPAGEGPAPNRTASNRTPANGAPANGGGSQACPAPSALPRRTPGKSRWGPGKPPRPARPIPPQLGVAALLVPQGDPAALAAAVESLLGDPGLAARLGATAAKRAAELPDTADAVDSVTRLYRRLLRQAG